MSFTKTLTLATTAVSLLAGCAVADDFVRDPSADHVGRILHYERSNQDGSLVENILVYRASASELEVFKYVRPCTNAALVTADLDFETFSASRFVGGRLLPEADVMEFAFLERNAAGDRADLLAQLPNMELRNEFEIRQSNWHLYDFDLASLTAITPYLADPEAAFDFGMALLWTDPSVEDQAVWMGDVHARPQGLVEGEYVFTLTGSALTGDRSTGSTGTLRIDAAEGHITHADLPVPNHSGYTDFQLDLVSVDDGGADAWDALLRAHWEGCED